VVVLDHSSTDSTVELLRALIPHVQILHYAGPLDFATMRNQVLGAAQQLLTNPLTEWLLVSLDFDEWVDANWHEELLAWYNEQPAPVLGALRYCDRGVFWSQPKVSPAEFLVSWHYMVHEVLTSNLATITVEPLLVEHRPLEKSRNYLPLLQQQTERWPTDSRTWFYYARELHATGDVGAAIGAWLTCLRHSGWSWERSDVCCRLANAIPSDGWYWNSRAVVEEVANRQAHVQLADYYFEQCNWPAAITALTTMLTVATTKPDCYFYDPTHWGFLPWVKLANSYYNLALYSHSLRCAEFARVANGGDTPSELSSLFAKCLRHGPSRAATGDLPCLI